jgi:uncharacterized protein YcbK (DUF882 family)
MGDLTKNISRHELKCKCGKCEVTIQDHEPIIRVVQRLCDIAAKAAGVEKVMLAITSAARCYEYNREVGSNDNSQHPRCNAMDVKLFANGNQISTKMITDIINMEIDHQGGAGQYPTFNHLDMRNKYTRWFG